MAKISKIQSNEKKKKKAAKDKKSRSHLRDKVRDVSLPVVERINAFKNLQEMGVNNENRVKNRCWKSGRPRGYIRYFGLSRTSFREIASLGVFPGVEKNS